MGGSVRRDGPIIISGRGIGVGGKTDEANAVVRRFIPLSCQLSAGHGGIWKGSLRDEVSMR